MRVHPLVSRMLLSGIIFVVMLNVHSVYGIDIFEAFFIRLKCFKSTQVGCQLDFTDKHTDLSLSSDNMTKAETYFLLYTRESPDEPELMHKCADQVGYLPQRTTFNSACRTEIVLPGYVCGVCPFAILRELKNERLKSGCYNVILVDWTWGNGPDLVEAKANIPIVAKQVAIIIKALKSRFHLSADAFILTGHSYGAHIAGIVGQMEPVGIINGIEPAGGLFTEDMPLDERLDAGDASCVQVFHTNAGQCLPGYFGVDFECGDIDVWFNDGLYQESYFPYIFISLLKGDYLHALYYLYPPAGSHMQAMQYYKASINPTSCQFIGIDCTRKRFLKHRCTNCGINGEKCSSVGAYGCDCRTTKEHRNLFVKTELLCPWCDNTKLHNANLTCGTKPPGS